jgi:type IV secretory pathway VirB10-like protein
MSEPQAPAPESMTPPPARRLNRLTLGLALAIGALMFTAGALVLTAPKAPTYAAGASPKDARPAEATFLNNPPRQRPVPADEAQDARIAALLRGAQRPTSPSGPFALGPQVPSPPTTNAPGITGGPAGPPPFGGTSSPPDSEPPPPGVYRPYPTTGSTYSRQALPAPLAARPSWQAAFASSLLPASASTAAGAPTLQPPPLTPPPPPAIAALATASPQKEPAVPSSPPERSVVARAPVRNQARSLRAGSVLTAVLLTAISTEVPGDAVAHVVSDVYAQDGSLLLPRGTRLLGSYKNRVAIGDHRLAIAWDRIVIDNRSYDLPALPSTSADGASGVPAAVDNHTALVFGRAALLSLISAGAQLGQPRQSRLGASLSNREVVSGSVSQQLTQAATEFLNRAVDVAPTLSIPAGTRLTVLLPYDLELASN